MGIENIYNTLQDPGNATSGGGAVGGGTTSQPSFGASQSFAGQSDWRALEVAFLRWMGGMGYNKGNPATGLYMGQPANWPDSQALATLWNTFMNTQGKQMADQSGAQDAINQGNRAMTRPQQWDLQTQRKR
jgi:hypothetical protein